MDTILLSITGWERPSRPSWTWWNTGSCRSSWSCWSSWISWRRWWQGQLLSIITVSLSNDFAVAWESGSIEIKKLWSIPWKANSYCGIIFWGLLPTWSDILSVIFNWIQGKMSKGSESHEVQGIAVELSHFYAKSKSIRDKQRISCTKANIVRMLSFIK